MGHRPREPLSSRDEPVMIPGLHADPGHLDSSRGQELWCTLLVAIQDLKDARAAVGTKNVDDRTVYASIEHCPTDTEPRPLSLKGGIGPCSSARAISTRFFFARYARRRRRSKLVCCGRQVQFLRVECGRQSGRKGQYGRFDVLLRIVRRRPERVLSSLRDSRDLRPPARAFIRRPTGGGANIRSRFASAVEFRRRPG